MCRLILYIKKTTQVLVVLHAHARWRMEKILDRDDGGGKTRSTKNADYIDAHDKKIRYDFFKINYGFFSHLFKRSGSAITVTAHIMSD